MRKNQLKEDGTVMLVAPFAHGDKVTNHGLPTAKMLYGASTVLRTPNSLSQDVARGLSAQAGEPGMAAVFAQAEYS